MPVWLVFLIGVIVGAALEMISEDLSSRRKPIDVTAHDPEDKTNA